MSDYSDDFDEGAKAYSKNSPCLKSQESQPDSFYQNLASLKAEIKGLEIEQLQSLESVGSVETIELADDSSEDDIYFIKTRQKELKIRNQPNPARIREKIIHSRLLPERENEKICSSQSRNSQRKPISSIRKELKSNENSFFYSRPKQIVSAVGNIKTFKKFYRKTDRQNSRDVTVMDSFDRDITNGHDWKKSALESYVNSENFHFNWEEDESMMTEGEILQNKSNYDIKILAKTFKKLSKEMFYNGKFNSATAKVEVQRLLLARKTLISLLKSVHEREDLMIALLTLGREAGKDLHSMIEQLQILNKVILVAIQRLKDSILGIKSFIYFGEDYEKKIQEDSKRIKRFAL